MCFIRQMSVLFLTGFICMCSSAYAKLTYEQDLTLGNWVSQQAVENEVIEFCRNAEGDPNIKVINVEYHEPVEEEPPYYSATITCHVSEIDKDLARIREIGFQRHHASGEKEGVADPDLSINSPEDIQDE